MSLTSAHPGASAPPSPAATPPSPAVSALVSRFTAPSGVHPPVEPSLGKALLNCKAPIGSYVTTAATVLLAVPETYGASFALGVARIGMAAASVQNCLAQQETAQVTDGNHANQIAVCKSQNAIPLLTMDGAVVCAK